MGIKMDNMNVSEALEAAAEKYNKASASEQPTLRGIIVKFLADMYGLFEDEIESQIEW